MQVKLKPIQEQVLVITGASSGIGLATARAAAQAGANLVLAARSGHALDDLGQELRSAGSKVHIVQTDVSHPEQMANLAEQAIGQFGRYDTWVNNAGTSIYGKLEEVPIDDMRRLFDTNFWGIVYGSLEAVKHLKKGGGALINVGSTVSERAIPLQGIYSASKHAVKGFTDALRMELESEGAAVSVTLVKPGAIDTPFTMNAKNYLGSEPQHVPPVYAPETVADAILHAAQNPIRDVFVGGGGKFIAALGQWAPRLTDVIMEETVISGTESGRPAGPRQDNGLERASERLQTRGDYPGHVAQSSLYTQASLHPILAGAAVLGVGLALRAALGGRPTGPSSRLRMR